MTPTNRDSAAAFVLPGIGRFPTLGSRRQEASGDKSSPWLTVKEAAKRARCGIKLIYREVKAERLQAARVGGRRELRFRVEWIDDWLDTHRVIK
jgi:excisionase family DNA binding protein